MRYIKPEDGYQAVAKIHVPSDTDKMLEVYLEIAQYPLLAQDVRCRMREKLFHRGIVTPQRFDADAKEKVFISQGREAEHTGEE